MIKSTPDSNFCTWGDYYGYPSTIVDKTVPLGLGPLGFGRTNRGCSDCGACGPRIWECADGAMVEFVGIEFAKDVEYQSDVYNTTQENIINHYLRKQAPYQIVFNTGLHDMGVDMRGVDVGSPERLKKFGLVDSYGENLLWYGRLLKKTLEPHGTFFVWLSTTSIRADLQPEVYKETTNNAKSELLNIAASKVMHTLGIPVIDLYAISRLPYFQNLNNDGVHYGGDDDLFYKLVAFHLHLRLCARSLYEK